MACDFHTISLQHLYRFMNESVHLAHVLWVRFGPKKLTL